MACVVCILNNRAGRMCTHVRLYCTYVRTYGCVYCELFMCTYVHTYINNSHNVHSNPTYVYVCKLAKALNTY